LLVLLLLASGAVLFAPRALTEKVQLKFAAVFRGPLMLAREVSLSHTGDTQAEYVTQRRYNMLRNYLANITEELVQERRKVQELSGVHNRRPLEGAQLLFADVITVLGEQPETRLLINAGWEDGLQEGQFVAGDYSIIGKVWSVGRRAAEVRLITNPECSIIVKVGQLHIDNVLKGIGNSRARITLLPTKYDVLVGDLVYAKKQPGLLDTAMIVGTVCRCKRDDANPLLWEVEVQPACETEELEAVTVIIQHRPQ